MGAAEEMLAGIAAANAELNKTPEPKPEVKPEPKPDTKPEEVKSKAEEVYDESFDFYGDMVKPTKEEKKEEPKKEEKPKEEPKPEEKPEEKKEEPKEQTAPTKNEPPKETTAKKIEIDEAEYNEMVKKLDYYINFEKLLLDQPKEVFQTIVPDIFKQPVDIQAELKKEFGNEFFDTEFNEREAFVAGTKSYEYRLRADELYQKNKQLEKPNADKGLQHNRELYDETMEYVEAVKTDLKNLGLTPIDIDKYSTYIDTQIVNKDGTVNPVKAALMAVKMKAYLEKGITDEARKIAAEMIVDENKRKTILPTPSEGTAPVKKVEPPEPSDFDDLETRGAPKFK